MAAPTDTKLEAVEIERSHGGDEGASGDGQQGLSGPIEPAGRDGDRVTVKTWLVIVMLSLSYGLSYWPVTSLSTVQGHIATVLGDGTQAVWFISVYNIGITSGFMICGSNSDLFGRRWFILAGNVFMVVGTVVAGSAKSVTAVIVGMALSGFGGANCSIAVFAIPELLPNKWRHIGVVIADVSFFVDIICGPSVTRFATTDSSTWRWIFYANSIASAIAGTLLFFFYHPPRHPRGLSGARALRELDYVGGLLFVAGTVAILSGIAYAAFLPSTDPHVLGLLISGFGVMVLFSLWETFGNAKQPLTPTRLFTHNRGRTLSIPFLASMVITVYYLAINVIWGTAVSVLFATSTVDGAKLALVQGFGFASGAVALGLFGGTIKRWRTMYFIMAFFATLFGGLLALMRPDRRGLSIAFTFLNSITFAWAQLMSVTFCQFGADQTELGIAGGLAGVARYGGSAVAGTVFPTILANVVSDNSYRVIDAAMAAGASQQVAEQILAAIPLGAQALASIPGATAPMILAASGGFVQSYVVALRTTALVSIAFGTVAMICIPFLEDITPKMNPKIEVYLENDVYAEKNKFH